MAAVITSAMLGTALGLGDDIDQARAAQVIDMAVGEVEALTGKLRSLTSTVELPYDGRDVDLPSRIVTAVSVVQIDGTATTDWEWLKPLPVVRVRGCVLGSGTWHTIKVTYTHGYRVPPPLAKSVVLELAKRAYGNPARLVSARIDDYSETFAPSAGLSDLEIAQLERAGLVQSASTTGGGQ